MKRFEFEEEVAKKVQERFLSVIDYITFSDKRVSAKIKKEVIHHLCEFLKEKFGFDHISSITSIDYGSHFGLAYNLWSTRKAVMFTLKIDVPKDSPKVHTVSHIWGGANWHEREAYDLMGIVFEGHPNLKRILLSEDWVYFPLRKDFRHPFMKEETKEAEK